VRRDILAYLGMAVVAVAAAVLSFDSLWGLARLAGIGLPWLLPVAIDAYALTATRIWLQLAPTERARRYARWNTFAAITCSIIGNAAYHGFTAAGIHSLGPSGRGWLVAVAVAAVAPAALYAVAHLWSLVSSDQRISDGAGPVTDPVPVTSEAPANTFDPTRETQPSPLPRREPARAHRKTGTGSPTRGSRTEQMTVYARERIRAGHPPTGGELDREFGTRDLGRKVLRQVRAESNGHPVPEPVP
jgi:Protein of unknown function (DUF2637)